MEGNAANGWRRSNNSLSHLYGSGWQLSDGSLDYPWYYLLEWRNLDGFDAGLASTYHEVFRNLTAEEAHAARIVSSIHASAAATSSPRPSAKMRSAPCPTSFTL